MDNSSNEMVSQAKRDFFNVKKNGFLRKIKNTMACECANS